jgi:outer membrane protein assembly factor BamB
VSDSSHDTQREARHLYALDAATGELLWTFEVVSRFLPAATLDKGIIYVTTAGEVFALKP